MAWEQCWLQYRPVNGKWNLPAFRNIWVNSHEPCVATGASELQRGLLSMFGLRVSIGQLYENSACPSEPLREGWISESIRLEIRQSLADGYPRSAEGFEISVGSDSLLISADTGAGILYACYALLRKLRLGVAFCDLGGAEQPANPLRMLNHWDNADGSIERGYAGQSFFLKDGNILVNERTVDYARLVSSVGINAVAINNVNVAGEAVRLITGAHFQQLQALAGVFASHAIRLFLCLDFAAPMDIGGLPTADPLDADVQAWWNAKMAEVFAAVPNLGGFVVKADSEGRPGPFTYGRTHADGANMLARAVKPYGGVILWRCFVYNCQQDWRDQKTDRARSGYDTFVPLNGQFDESVALQVKYGPMDFQVREPISPLLGAMPDTNQILELQITQEYTGQQKHICYLVPMWREILGFQTYCKPADHRVADIVAGKTYGNALCGIAAVSNTGDQPNWTGSDTAAANLYGYGRLCWDTTLSAEAIAKEWIVQTYSEHPQAVTAITQMLISSWPAYEKYTSPLGIG
ncbi:MAG TPA: alpha-glucuronidase family glycosyl hydrolase, partial [Candidatus Limiplasma sp.]|nr:alpha-glucuronidase family glycosyl hydrolase [Candidatus Limiplasma sp.]